MFVDEMPMDKMSCYHNLFKISFETVADFKNKLNKANFERSFRKGKKYIETSRFLPSAT